MILLLVAAAVMPPIAFENRDGGTQVLMGRDLTVEFRQNRYLRFRATNRNDLWVGSEKQLMDLCRAYADPGINDFVFRAVQTRSTSGGFEIKIEADKPSLEGKVRIGLAARWLPAREVFEYTLTGNLDHHTLDGELQLGAVNKDDLYAAMDWMLARQASMEAVLARRHLRQGTLVLYDLSSTYFEGRHCPLAQYGYSRDERRSNP